MKKRILYSLMICLYGLMATAQAQPRVNGYQALTPVIRQYEKAEWAINLTAQYANPYHQKEVALDMALTSPSGKPLLLPCFYDDLDKNTIGWKARFTPQEAGIYTYCFKVTDKTSSAQSATGRFEVKASARPGFLHKNSHWTFRFDNGDLFRGIGENVGWESRSFEQDKWTYDYLLPTLSKNGANFFRTWMCPWNLPLEWQKISTTKRYTNSTNYFNPGGIKRMEQLLQLTDSLHLYFMLTLDMNSGHWPNNPYNEVNGGPIKTWAEFFTSQKAMEKYKDKLRYVVARWGYSTNIAAWEFFNEIDNGVFTSQDSIIIPTHTVTQWHNEMARYLKDIDPYQHLVTTSISHRDIVGLNSIAYIDFNQKHIYKHTEKIPAIYPDYIQTFGKPYVVGEFGYRWEDDDPKYATEANYDFKRGLWYGLFSPTPILPMSWWWELFDDQKMAPYFSSVKTISNLMLQAGNGHFNSVDVNAGSLHAQAVNCGSQTFVYLLNECDRQKQATVSVDLMNTPNAYVQAFDPDTRQYHQVTNFVISKNKLTLQGIRLDAKKDVILIISNNNQQKQKT